MSKSFPESITFMPTHFHMQKRLSSSRPPWRWRMRTKRWSIGPWWTPTGLVGYKGEISHNGCKIWKMMINYEHGRFVHGFFQHCQVPNPWITPYKSGSRVYPLVIPTSPVTAASRRDPCRSSPSKKPKRRKSIDVEPLGDLRCAADR